MHYNNYYEMSMEDFCFYPHFQKHNHYILIFFLPYVIHIAAYIVAQLKSKNIRWVLKHTKYNLTH